MNEDSFLAPPFKPDDALVQIRRALRDLKLAERGNGFELRGKRVAEAEVDGAIIRARIARRLMLTPEWDRFELRAATDQRKFVDEIRKRLARWEHEE
jgi:hypothetical protein